MEIIFIPKILLDRGKKHLDFFSSKINSDRFYRSVIDEYRKLNKELGCNLMLPKQFYC